MPLAISHDPQHWLDRAAETRAMAEKIVDPGAKRALLDTASSYEQIAVRAEERRRQDRSLAAQRVKEIG
jgi:hypothetical protein